MQSLKQDFQSPDFFGAVFFDGIRSVLPPDGAMIVGLTFKMQTPYSLVRWIGKKLEFGSEERMPFFDDVVLMVLGLVFVDDEDVVTDGGHG